jgi:iron uptake system component EfeO
MRMIRCTRAEGVPVPPEKRPSPRYSARQNRTFRLTVLGTVAAMVYVTLAINAMTHANPAPLDEAIEQYRLNLIEDIGQALSGVQTLQGRVAAKDIQGAKAAWISARAGWERSEVFTGAFVPDFDEKIDGWPNARTGFHAIEARLFGANQTDAEDDTDVIVERLTALNTKVREIELTRQGLLNGMAQLAYEIGEDKSDGGESRISGTSLDDMRNNVAGIENVYDIVFSSAIGSADPDLAHAARHEIDDLKVLLHVTSLNNVNIPKLRQVTEEFAITLQDVARKIGLRRPTLESSP